MDILFPAPPSIHMLMLNLQRMSYIDLVDTDPRQK